MSQRVGVGRKARAKLPEFPATLRVVIEDCNWDTGPEFHCLQPDESMPAEALDLAIYEYVGPKHVSKR